MDNHRIVIRRRNVQVVHCRRNTQVARYIRVKGIVDQHRRRVSYRPGNALTDDLGVNEYDVVMINNVVHHFTSEENFRLAKKIARALKSGGIYAVGEFIRSHKPREGDVEDRAPGFIFR